MWSSLFLGWEDSTRCRVDSWAPTIQLLNLHNPGFSTFLNFPLHVPILILLSCCINSSSLFPVAILCTLLHRENMSFEVWYLHSKLRETFPWIWQMWVRIDTPITVNFLFFYHIQISTSWPRYINVFYWNGKCFFLRHAELNSKFIVMTIDEVTFDRPEVGTGFSVICWFCRLRLSRFTLKFSAEIFSLLTVDSRLRVFSEFVVSPWQFCCTIWHREYEFIFLCCYQYFLSRWFSEDKYLMGPTFPHIPELLSEHLLSEFSPRLAHSQERFLVILSFQIDVFLLGLLEKTGDIQPLSQ